MTQAPTDRQQLVECGPWSWREGLLAAALALAVGVPFLNKPIHIDDPVVLHIAEQIIREPLNPFGGRLNWHGDPLPVFEVTSNPPLLSYWLAPVIARLGLGEVPLHLALLPFLVALALAARQLSRRFAGGSWWPVLFVMTSPAVVVSGNVMRDVPAAALSAAAVAGFVAGFDRRRPGLLLAGSLLAGCAVLTKYSAAILFPLLALYVLLYRRPRELGWLLPGLGVLGLWCLQNVVVHGTTHLQYLMAESRGTAPGQSHLLSALAIVGGCCLLAPAVAMVKAFGRRWWWWLSTGAAVMLLVFWLRRHFGEVTPQYYAHALLGGVLLWSVLMGLVESTVSRSEPAARERRCDDWFLAAWVGSVLYFSVALVMFQAVRHVLPAFVPLCLLTVRLLQRARQPTLLRPTLRFCLLLQTVLAFAVGLADQTYAQVYRKFVAEHQSLDAATGSRVWYHGNWGWHHYAHQAGWRKLATHGPLPATGDLVVIPLRVHKGRLHRELVSRLEEVSETVYRTRLHLYTMNGFQGAGFYAMVENELPYLFDFSDSVLEVFTVYRVAPADAGEF